MSNKDNGVDAALIFLDRFIHPITLFAGGIALVGLTLTIVTGVIFRYIFNSPIFGADDFNEMFLLATVAFSIAYSGRKGGQFFRWYEPGRFLHELRLRGAEVATCSEDQCVQALKARQQMKC